MPPKMLDLKKPQRGVGASFSRVTLQGPDPHYTYWKTMVFYKTGSKKTPTSDSDSKQ